MGVHSRQGESMHNRLTRRWECRLVPHHFRQTTRQRSSRTASCMILTTGDWLISKHRHTAWRANLTDEAWCQSGVSPSPMARFARSKAAENTRILWFSVTYRLQSLIKVKISCKSTLCVHVRLVLDRSEMLSAGTAAQAPSIASRLDRAGVSSMGAFLLKRL